MRTYAIVYWAALLLSVVLTPLVIRLAVSLGITDSPGPRKIHKRPIPRIGGVVIFVPTLALTGAACFVNNKVGLALRELLPSLIAVLGAACLLFVVGILDDIWGVRARYKLAGQVLGGLILVLGGVDFGAIRVTDQWVLHLGWMAVPLTLLWFVAVTNAVNLIDGLDGLAAGIALITCATLAGFALFAGTRVLAVPVLALLGALTGFLFFNFNPARIFLGDSGSLFLGAMLAGLGVLTAHKTSTLVAVALPVLVLGVPIFDTTLSFVRRLLQRRSPFSPDKGHIHHKLLEMGLNQRRAVLTLYGATLVLASLGMTLLVVRNAGMLIVLGLALTLLAVLFLFTGTFRPASALEAVRGNLRRLRIAGATRDAIERLWVQIADSPRLDTLWNGLVHEADALGILAIEFRPAGYGTRPPQYWSAREPSKSALSVHLTLANGGREFAYLSIVLSVREGLEQAAQKAALVARLIDAFPEMVGGGLQPAGSTLDAPGAALIPEVDGARVARGSHQATP